jgi:hypothetical protein
VDYRAVPLVIHLHGMAMTAWLGLLVVQATLADRGTVAVHRRLGWASAVMVPLILVAGSAACVTGLRLHAVPPFFTPAYFLALVHVELITFAVLVGCAVAMRGEREWHRRLIIASTIVIMEPALGRLLPMPLLGGWAEWLAMLVQFVPVAILARHDRQSIGAIHPATKVAVLAVVGSHVLFTLLGASAPLVALANAIAAG